MQGSRVKGSRQGKLCKRKEAGIKSGIGGWELEKFVADVIDGATANENKSLHQFIYAFPCLSALP